LKRANLHRKWSTIISKTADNLSKAGWSWGCVAAIDSNGRTIWIADAHRDDDKLFVVHADEKANCVSGTFESVIFPEISQAWRSRRRTHSMQSGKQHYLARFEVRLVRGLPRIAFSGFDEIRTV
jgi:hypothetical protein